MRGGGVGRTNKSISDNLNQQKSERHSQRRVRFLWSPKVGGFMKFANSGDFNPWEEIRERVPPIAGGRLAQYRARDSHKPQIQVSAPTLPPYTALALFNESDEWRL